MGADLITPEQRLRASSEGLEASTEFTAGHVAGAKNVWFGQWDEGWIRNPRFLEIVSANLLVIAT
jgi:hypothetical protein